MTHSPTQKSPGFRLSRWLVGLLMSLWEVTSIAAPPHLLLDINPTPVACCAYPQNFTDSDSWSFFSADDGSHSVQPWITDGTARNTFRWGSVNRVTGGSSGFPSRKVGDKVFLISDDTSSGTLWVSDGTRTGSHVVGPLPAGGDWTQFTPAGALGSQLVMSALNIKTGARELWLADGTGNPSVHLASASGAPYLTDTIVTVSTTAAYFMSQSLDGVFSPWITDGTTAGTRPLLVPTLAAGGSNAMQQLGPYVLFVAATSGSGSELWRIDTRDNSVAQVADVAPGSVSGVGYTPRFVSLGSVALFTAAADGQTFTVWRTDGTGAGTYALGSLPVAQGSPTVFLTANGLGRALYFTISNNFYQAWSTDGTVAGTVPLPISTGGNVSLIGRHFYMLDLNGGVWRTDGTVAGTTALKGWPTVNDYIMNVAGDESVVYVRVYDQDGHGGRLFVYDPASDRSTQLLSFSLKDIEAIIPKVFTYTRGLLYFDNEDPITGHEVWISNGTADGTHLLKDIAPNAQARTRSSDPDGFVAFNGYLYFAAYDGNSGREVWRTSGTSANTRLFADLNGGAPDSNPTDLFVAGGRLYMFGIDSSGAYQLFQSNGEPAGTVTLATVGPRPVPFRSRGCNSKGVALGALAVFAGYTDATGVQLWVTDGTPAGTHPLTHVMTDSRTGLGVCNLTAAGNVAFFSAGNSLSASGNELWSTDGTPQGTRQVADINRGPASASPAFLTPIDSRVFFAASNGSAGAQLWSSDGSTNGTVAQATPGSGMLSEIYGHVGSDLFVSVTAGAGSDIWLTNGAAAGSSSLLASLLNPTGFVNRDRLLVAGAPVASPDLVGLWTTDGTVAGTHSLLQTPDISVLPDAWRDFNHDTVFQIRDVSGATMLWRTDGTANGTMSLGIATGGSDGATLGDTYYFSGDDGVTGAELWAIQNDAPTVADSNIQNVATGASVTIDLTVGATDQDGSIDPNSVVILTQPTRGTLVLGANGQAIYTSTAPATLNGSDRFIFSIADNQGATAVGVVTVELVPTPGSTSIPPSTSGTATSGHSGGGAAGWMELLALACLTAAGRYRAWSCARMRSCT